MCVLDKFCVCVIILFIGCIIVQMSSAEERILLERIVKSPWNVDNLAPDDIRCHCNLPVCITTNYMCRTARSSGGCFTEIPKIYNTDVARRHGCVELLPDNVQRIDCDNSPRKHVKPLNGNTAETLILCCQEDLCNNKKPNLTLDNDGVTTKSIGQQSLVTIGFQRSDTQTQISSSSSSSSSSSNDYNNDEFWFKIATIAVPVFGAIILFILIALAIRMLKNDHIESNTKLGGGGCCGGGGNSSGINPRKIHHHQHQQYDYEGNYNHSPLLKQNSHNYMNATAIGNVCSVGGSVGGGGTTHIGNVHQQQLQHQHHQQQHQLNSDKKNETQAKINQLMHLEYSLLPQSCHEQSSVKQTNTDLVNNSLYRNVNLITTNKYKSRDLCDKIYEKEVLNPVTVNWAGQSNCINHNNNINNNNNTNNNSNSNNNCNSGSSSGSGGGNTINNTVTYEM